MIETSHSTGWTKSNGLILKLYLSTSLTMITQCSSKSYQTELAEMNKFGENSLKRMSLRRCQFLIMKRRLMLTRILVTSSDFV
jgi:hypothetical protein